MKFSKEEKKFWQRNYRIERVEEIPADWTFFKSVDGDVDDDFFYMLTLRVNTIVEVYLKDTLITDKSVEYFLNFKKLEDLNIRKNRFITKACISFINQMDHLESVNLDRTQITLTDLCEQLDNQNLKKVFISSAGNEENIAEKAFLLKSKMPNCDVYLNCSHTTDVFGNEQKPIF